jgi:hypothetical protein
MISPFCFRGKKRRAARGERRWAALKEELPYIVLVSNPEQKAKSSAVAARNLMIFVKPAVLCPIECNQLLVCVTPRADLVRRVRALQQVDCPRAPANGLSTHSGKRIARALWQQA